MYSYNGHKLTEYEASQQQRYIERQIRRWKREETAMKAAGLSADEAAAKVAQWQGRQRDFVRQTGMKRQGDRETVGAFKFKGMSASGDNGDIREMPRIIGKLDSVDLGTVSQFFDIVRMKAERLSYEINYTVTADGNVWYTRGTEGTVHPERISKSLFGSYSYHNHIEQRTKYSFSGEDLGFFFEHHQEYSSASDTWFRYVMKRTPQTIQLSYEDAYYEFNRIYSEEILQLAFDGLIDVDTDGYHLAVSKMAEKFHFIYERMGNNG